MMSHDPSTSSPRLTVRDSRVGRLLRVRLLWGLSIAAICLAAVLLVWGPGRRTYRLRISAGSRLGHRHQLAEILSQEAATRRLKLDLIGTSGSREAIDKLAAGELDVALVQGGLKAEDHVRQVAVLLPEPLHLLVRPELAGQGISALRGKRLNLSTPGSGTRVLATQLLDFVGLRPVDYRDAAFSYRELRQLPPDELPEGIFVVSPLPSQMAKWLVQECGYRLLALPYGPAMSLRDASIRECHIPAHAYRVFPSVPSEELPTVGARLSVLAHEDVPEQAVIRLLEAIYDGDFARRAELQGLAAADVQQGNEKPLHPGSITYLNRHRPLLSGEVIESAENLRSFVVSAAVALFLIWRWSVRRRAIGFETYIDRITKLEVDLLRSARGKRLDGNELMQADRALTQIKSEALEQFSAGRLKGGELLSSFLTHVGDVRAVVHRLSLDTSEAK